MRARWLVLALCVSSASAEPLTPEGRYALELACTPEALPPCIELGLALMYGKGGPVDRSRALFVLAGACQGGAAEACTLHGAALLVEDRARAIKSFERGCALKNQVSCDRVALLAGEAPRRNGEADREAGERLAELQKAQPANPDEIAGANLRMASVNVDGVELKDVVCKTTGGGFAGLFGGLAIGAGFKERKAKLAACATRSSAESRVAWKSTSNRMTNLHVTGNSPAINHCIERALLGAPSTVSGTCAATVVHGGH